MLYHPQVGLHEVPWELGKPRRSGNLLCPWNSSLPWLLVPCTVSPTRHFPSSRISAQLSRLAMVPRGVCASRLWVPWPTHLPHEGVLLVGAAQCSGLEGFVKGSQSWRALSYILLCKASTGLVSDSGSQPGLDCCHTLRLGVLQLILCIGFTHTLSVKGSGLSFVDLEH